MAHAKYARPSQLYKPPVYYAATCNREREHGAYAIFTAQLEVGRNLIWLPGEWVRGHATCGQCQIQMILATPQISEAALGVILLTSYKAENSYWIKSCEKAIFHLTLTTLRLYRHVFQPLIPQFLKSLYMHRLRRRLPTTLPIWNAIPNLKGWIAQSR